MKLSDRIRGAGVAPTFCQYADEVAELEQQLEDYKCDLDEEIKEGVETSKRNIKVRKERDELKAELSRFTDALQTAITAKGKAENDERLQRVENERLRDAITEWYNEHYKDIPGDGHRLLREITQEALAEGKDDSV